MQPNFKKYIKDLFKCRHKNALLYSNEGFCPDCGRYLKKNYYVVRCAHCDFKRAAKKNFDEIAPVEKFCTNCGESGFIIEKYDRLNFVDINYAIEVKEEVERESLSLGFEIWVDKAPATTEKEKPDKMPPLIGRIKYPDISV